VKPTQISRQNNKKTTEGEEIQVNWIREGTHPDDYEVDFPACREDPKIGQKKKWTAQGR